MTKELAVELCKVWDVKGLLPLFPYELGPGSIHGCTKVFNNFKNAYADRQIGDRRSQNYQEGKLPGPSKSFLRAESFCNYDPGAFRKGSWLCG